MTQYYVNGSSGSRMGWHSLDYFSVDMNKWQALVNMLMNLWFHKILGIQPAQESLACSEGLCDMQLVG